MIKYTKNKKNKKNRVKGQKKKVRFLHLASKKKTLGVIGSRKLGLCVLESERICMCLVLFFIFLSALKND